jgi:NLR family CARD domain-containing protein 3
MAVILKVNTSLSELSLGCNNVGNDGVTALGEALKVNRSLSGLYLDGNNVGDEGAVAIADVLKFNKTLWQLDLALEQRNATLWWLELQGLGQYYFHVR